MADTALLRSQIAALNTEILLLRQEIAVNQATLERLQTDLATRASFYDNNPAARQALIGNIDTYRLTIAQQQARLETLLGELGQKEAQLQASVEVSAVLPTASAAVVAKEDQQARAEGALNSNPPQPDLEYNNERDETVVAQAQVPTNAETFTENTETQDTVNTPRVPIVRSQATPPNATRSPTPAAINNEPFAVANEDGIFGGGFSTWEQVPGVGAPTDDAGRVTPTTTRATIDTLFAGTRYEKPQPNILSKYASYTYNISLYIMDKEDFQKMLRTGRKDIQGYQLLMQSGGAPSTSPSGPPVPTATASTFTAGPEVPGQLPDVTVTASRLPPLNRNQFFPLDYYIDDVQIQSKVTGKGVQGAHNVTELKFKIFEPNGISLIQNLVACAKEYTGNGQPISYAAQNYLMVIRFYGYDDAGNLVKPEGDRPPGSTTDPYATVEKWIPFIFTNIKFRVANAVTEYQCDCAVPQNAVATGQARGVIPFNVQFTGKTLKDIFQGSTQSGSVTTAPSPAFEQDPNQSPAETARLNRAAASAPPPKASAAAQSGQKFAVGLCEALNRFQAERVQQGQYQYADEYVVKLLPPIDNATVKPPGDLNFKYTPMMRPETAAQAWLGSKQLAQTENKNFNAFAGQSIVQFLDLAVRSSSYIYDQQIWNIVTDDSGKQTLQSNGTPAQNLAWYRIGMQVEPLRFDEIRKDWTYRITYQINPYLVSNVKSNYFVQSPIQIPHKEYNYWFTGQNDEVLNFTQDFNYLYYIVNNAKPGTPRKITNWQDIEKRVYQPASDQSDQGAENAVNEPGANAADYLYSPRDTAQVKLTIVGDPAWIQQGELWRGVAGTQTQMNYDKFSSDGTINYEGREIQFRLNYNTPVDYDLQTGLMDPGQKNFGANRQTGQAGAAQQSNTYRAIEVISYFNKGRFTQDLSGAQIFYDNPVNSGSSTSQSNASADDWVEQDGVYVLRSEINARAEAERQAASQEQQGDAVPLASADMMADPDINLETAYSSTTDITAQVVAENQSTSAAPPSEPSESSGQVVGTVVVTVPEVTVLPTGTTRDPTGGFYVYDNTDLVAGTNEALNTQISAINTGQVVTYVDYDRNSGWVTKTYNPRSGAYNIVGPAPDPNTVNVASSAQQQIVRES